MSISKTLVPLGVTLSAILFAGQAVADEPQVKISGKSATTSVEMQQKETGEVANKTDKVPAASNRTSSYSSKQVTTDLKAELQLELEDRKSVV